MYRKIHATCVLNLSLNLKLFDINATLLLNYLQHKINAFKIEQKDMWNKVQKESLCNLTQAQDNVWNGEYDKHTWKVFCNGL